MCETKFIEQNQPKWEELERVLESPYKNPDNLNELFIQVTDDLSYSRTFYPNRSVRVYLNGLAQRIFLSIYRNRKSQRHRLITFWTDELPHLVYESRQAFRLSFFVFALAMAIGMLSCAMDPDFAAVILGEDYVQMTEENIRSGDPMRVYKQRGEFGMTLGITVNNIYVSFLTFVLGVFFSIGSIALLLYNGVMVGAFQYFFIERGLFWESFLTIWMHGALEISAIVIAGAAGITMGQGLLFPGTYTRMQAFQRSARRGIKIMVGIAPLFIVAGFIEGYLTRHTDLPDVARGFFIVVCLLVVLVYFVWYPWMKSRIGFDAPIRDARIPPDDMLHLNFTQIKPSGEILADAILLLKSASENCCLYAGRGAIVYFVVFIFAGKPRSGIFFSLRHVFSGDPDGAVFSASILRWPRLWHGSS
ncbi:MAG: stage II sporulation protein M [Saprospiraceae bacterium]|nr:stage II sporulation protein M [Saprospiraceae bacterium]